MFLNVVRFQIELEISGHFAHLALEHSRLWQMHYHNMALRDLSKTRFEITAFEIFLKRS